MLRERQGVAGEWRKLCIEELNDLYWSPDAIRVTVSGGMRWTGHVARVGEKRNACRIWWGNLRERDHLEDLGQD